MTFELEVVTTQEDIDNGIAQECQECPLAISVYRALVAAHPEYSELVPYVHQHAVHLTRWRLTPPHGEELMFTAVMPETGTWFVTEFDECQPVEPFTMTLTFEEA